jgi:hypothetical protein
MKMRKVVALIAATLVSLLGASQVPAIGATVPQAPGFSKATLQVIVDNDYAAFMGDANNVTRLFYQNNYPWMTQITNATSLDIFPQTGETYIYLAVMGGGGTEDWAGKLNGLDVVDIPGAQAASGRTPLGSGSLSSPYVTLQGYVSSYNTTDVANGVQNVTLAEMQSALTGATWSSAVSTGSGTGNIPTHKTTGVCCGTDAVNGGMTGKGWNFPSNSLVVFRYPLSSLGLPVRAGNSQVTVDWDAPAAGDAPTGYIVQYKKSTDPDSAYTTFSTPSAPTTIETVTGLTNGVFYSFRVAGTNSYGTGAFSAVRESMPIGPAPAPTSLIPTPKASSVQVAFTDPIANGGSAITNYEYSIDGGSTWAALSPADTTTPVTITGLTDGTTYSIKLRAVNSSGSGTASAAVSVTPGLVARLTNLTLSNAPAKGLTTTISVTLNVSGKVTYLVDGKRIAGCLKLNSSGASPNISSSCTWKPTVMGRHFITVQHVPTDNSYANGSLTSTAIQVVKRNTTR